MKIIKTRQPGTYIGATGREIRMSDMAGPHIDNAIAKHARSGDSRMIAELKAEQARRRG